MRDSGGSGNYGLQGFRLRVQGLGPLGFRVLGFRVWGLGLRVRGFWAAGFQALAFAEGTLSPAPPPPPPYTPKCLDKNNTKVPGTLNGLGIRVIAPE